METTPFTPIKNVARNILAKILDYRSVIACKRVCREWRTLFSPESRTLEQWMREKHPRIFLRDAMELNDIRLVEFIIDIQNKREARQTFVKSKQMIDMLESKGVMITHKTLAKNIELGIEPQNSLSYRIFKHQVPMDNVCYNHYIFEMAIVSDNLELVKKCSLEMHFTDALATKAAINFAFNSLHYFVNDMNGLFINF